MLFALTATFVALFGAGPGAAVPGGLTAGVLSVAVVVLVAALLVRVAPAVRGTDATVRSRSLRRHAARLGRIVVRDPDAPGRPRPRAPGRMVVSA
ncbi:hypothetical protein CLV30_108184 [Haloactinopolyspora alba]|uniref:Uncharacterized protein n=1 Tax=Haloactinopolyspora alba TaxID=648780 RepID=A0A2P8E1C3_9ACTN|nr:DUF6412 domain-containing protein [Haloactinopolyspora alba]PSL03272.1 hypothetical protein CLV30_108184 [Haloactinopolyspora alba]